MLRTYTYKLIRRGQLETKLFSTPSPVAYARADQVAEIQRREFGGHPDEVVTFSEAAAEYGLSLDQIRRRVRWGQLHPVGEGRHPRLLRVEVERVAASLRL